MFVHLFQESRANIVSLKEIPESKNPFFVGQANQFEVGNLIHGFDLVKSIFHRWNTQIMKPPQGVSGKRGSKRIRMRTGSVP